MGARAVVRVAAGAVICLAGALVLRYPEASYALGAGWKQDEPTLSGAGRTDQRLHDLVVVGIGLWVVVWGLP